MNYFTDIHDYIFGSNGYAGIGPISGDAGCKVDYTMKQNDFDSIVEVYLEGEDDDEKRSALSAEFACAHTRAQLYRRFRSLEPTVD